ncbi:MAG: chloride channel protein [Planctomycetota bacterium]
MILPAMIGAVAAVGAIVFYSMLGLSHSFFFEYLGGYHPPGPAGEAPLFDWGRGIEPRPWMLLVLPTIGGLVSGILVYSLAPEAEGHGTDAAIEAYHNKGGEVRGRVPFVKAIASAIMIGTGGSAGREGPIAQIGAGFGSLVGKWFRLSAKDRRVLLTAGMAGGIGSIFHAPVAGALFASEVLYKRMELEGEVLVPATVSSIIAYTLFASMFGWEPLFLIQQDLEFKHLYELLPYTILALCVVLGAFVYAKSFYMIKDLFVRIPGPRHIKPAIGGLAVGLIGFFGWPDALGSGYGVIQGAIQGNLTLHFLLAVAGLKILTTGFTIGSGGSGGMFGPSVVIGGALAGAVGLGLGNLFPGMIEHPESYVIVGMAGFFAAAANTPISTVIMVTEMTGSYHLLLPTLWVCVISYVLLNKTTIYDTQPAGPLDSPAHLNEMMAETLKRISVREAMDSGKSEMVTLERSTSLKEILDLFSTTQQESFPVLDSEGRLMGSLNSRALRAIAGQAELLQLIVAEDLAMPLPSVTPDEDLLHATKTMSQAGTDEVFVVHPVEQDRLLGILHRQQVVAVYAMQVMSEGAD